jgi:hypothetical protein
MAYTQDIDPATPAGGANAHTADDQIRALKRDIIERLESIFRDANEDPLVFDAAYFPDESGLAKPYLQATGVGGTAPGMVELGLQIISRLGDSPLQAAHVNNNSKFYIDSSLGGGNYRLVIHLNGQRYALNMTLIP